MPEYKYIKKYSNILMKRLLLVLNGESFRSGSQMTRERGTKNYIERQTIACMTHVNFIHRIKEKYNIDTHIIIQTYKLNDTDDEYLLNFYKTQGINIIYSNFLDSICSSEKEFLSLTFDKVNEYISNYDFCIFIRIDLYLKKYFIDNMLFDNKIQFSHVDCNFRDEIITIGHAIFYFPKNYFYVIQNKVTCLDEPHNMYFILYNSGIPSSEFKFMVDTAHICSTDIASNPLYCQVGRKYNNSYIYVDHQLENYFYIYNKILDRVIYDKETVKLKWAEYDTYNADDDEVLRICY